MSRYFDLSQNAVLFADFMLPREAFMTTRDTSEMKLVSQIFDFAQTLAELKLSEYALALYSAYILLQDGKNLIGITVHAPFFNTYCFSSRPNRFEKRRTGPQSQSSSAPSPAA